ncbi:MAG: hypothetical protein ACQERB_14715, partial [Promethearchaeati archaeon]
DAQIFSFAISQVFEAYGCVLTHNLVIQEYSGLRHLGNVVLSYLVYLRYSFLINKISFKIKNML